MLLKTRPCGIPSATFCLWFNRLEGCFVCSFVSVRGCGCALCACVCLLYMGQLSDLGLRAPLDSFQYNLVELLCQLHPLTSSNSPSSAHYGTLTHVKT